MPEILMKCTFNSNCQTLLTINRAKQEMIITEEQDE